MTHEEMQRILELMRQQREAFTEQQEQRKQQQERFQVDLERLETNHEKIQAQMIELARTVQEIGYGQVQMQQAITQTQNDLSHLAKIFNGLVEIVARDLNGGG